MLKFWVRSQEANLFLKTRGVHIVSACKSPQAPSQKHMVLSLCLSTRCTRSFSSCSDTRLFIPRIQTRHQKQVLAVKNVHIVPALSLSTTRVFCDATPVDEKVSSITNALPPDYIPKPPPIPEAESVLATDVTQLAQDVIETPASLGLGGWWPPGIVQECLFYLHSSCNMPWWMAIVTGTIVVRTLMFPLVVKAQQNAANMNNNMPQMQILQLKMTEARKSGNALEAAKYAHELMAFMKEKNMNPLKGMIVPLAQAPVFISVFLGLRRMANVPVESFKDGGLFWFTNLTVPDPYYLLPLITCSTLFLSIELGAEGGIRTDSMQMMRYVLRALPVVIFPFLLHFPSAILVYWCTSNFITLGQVALLRLPKARNYFNIPILIRHKPSELPKKKGFVEGIKETMTNTKIINEIEDRHRVDEVRFKRAGSGPLIKTYPYDPTKQKTIAAKSAEGRSSSSKV